MNEKKKGITANTPKKLTVEDLKKLIGGLGADTTALHCEDEKLNKCSPNFA